MTYVNISVFLLVLSGLLLVAFTLIARKQPQVHASADFHAENGQEEGPIEPDIVLPRTWDEKQINGTIQRYKNRSAVLSHYVSALQERFIIRQDDRTAQIRTEFLRTKLEMLKLGKEVQVAIDDLRLHEVERDIRRRKLELEQRDLENRQKKQDELEALSHERDKLKIKFDIAQTQKDIDDLHRPPPPPLPPAPPVPTAEELRQQNKRRCKERLERLGKEEGEDIFKITKGSPFQELSEQEQAAVIHIRHMYGQAKERVTEELEKYL